MRAVPQFGERRAGRTYADRPAALAELMGIVVNDGIRRPTVRIDELRFAAGWIGLHHDFGGRHVAEMRLAQGRDQIRPGKRRVNGGGVENMHVEPFRS